MSTCSGRLGDIVEQVLVKFNDEREQHIDQDQIVSWVNECLHKIAIKGYWKSDTAVDVVANQADYTMETIIPGYQDVLNIIWAETGCHLNRYTTGRHGCLCRLPHLPGLITII